MKTNSSSYATSRAIEKTKDSLFELFVIIMKECNEINRNRLNEKLKI